MIRGKHWAASIPYRDLHQHSLHSSALTPQWFRQDNSHIANHHRALKGIEKIISSQQFPPNQEFLCKISPDFHPEILILTTKFHFTSCHISKSDKFYYTCLRYPNFHLMITIIMICKSERRLPAYIHSVLVLPMMLLLGPTPRPLNCGYTLIM